MLGACSVPSHSLNQCLLPVTPQRTSCNGKRIKLGNFSADDMYLTLLSAKWHPLCSDLNALAISGMTVYRMFNASTGISDSVNSLSPSITNFASAMKLTISIAVYRGLNNQTKEPDIINKFMYAFYTPKTEGILSSPLPRLSMCLYVSPSVHRPYDQACPHDNSINIFPMYFGWNVYGWISQTSSMMGIVPSCST